MASDTPKTKLLDLPVDILYLLFPYLDVPDFIALTSTCAALHQPDISQYARYWSTATRSTFRVPNQPVVENDGVRWQKMYKRLLTQSKVYSWGNNEMGCLGHSVLTNEQLNTVPPASRRRLAMRSRHVSWPTEMLNTDSIGVIADMQCGGWSTNLLTSKGAIYSVGVLDGLHVMHNRGIFTQRSHPVPTKLRYPPGFLHPSERYDTATAVRQFSAGRAHILAVSDSGRIWSWQNIDHAAYNVKFLNIELKEQAKIDEVGHVDKVVAGWDKSCALVNGAGIVLWDVLKRDVGSEESEEDAALVLETATVPMTAYRQPRVNARSSYTRDGEHIGEVLNFICLEKYVLFNTHLGKVFASSITWNNQVQSLSVPAEIVIPSEDGSFVNEERFAADIQGSFRSFAVFTRDGAVLIGHQDMLDHLANRSGPLVTLKRFPALQNTGVISLAFGDYHFHALHASGHITSYGNEPQACGALGLGGHGDPEGRLRGLRYQGIAGDARLVPHAYSTGRRVWFEREKQAWITFLTSGGADPEEARERLQMCHDTNVQAEVSEWVEQEGRAWEDRFGGEHRLDDDGLGAYFALNVTAAGWHSGALVLVNEELAKSVSDSCLVASPIEHDEQTSESGRSENEDNGIAEVRADQQQPDERALLERGLSYVADWGRWFLGLPTSTERVPSAGINAVPPRVSSRHDPNNPHAFIHPNNHGAAAEDGRPYAWANDSFPRLRLSDGREMPGQIEISEWRFGRPEWDLSVVV